MGLNEIEVICSMVAGGWDYGRIDAVKIIGNKGHTNRARKMRWP